MSEIKATVGKWVVRHRSWGAVLVICALTAQSHAADGDIIASMTAGRIERIITSFQDVKNFQERGNNVYRFEVDGLKVLLFNKAETMQLAASFSGKITLSRINEWNRTKRFTRAYLDNDNEPMLEGDIELTGGVTERNVKEWFKTYVASLKAFQKHISPE